MNGKYTIFKNGSAIRQYAQFGIAEANYLRMYHDANLDDDVLSLVDPSGCTIYTNEDVL